MTDLTKHTPGPLIARESDHSARWIVETKDGALIADCFNAHSEQNAKLFAAAPELLEALKGCLAYIEQSEAHRGKSLNSDEIEREVKRVRETVSVVETGPYWGPVARADLDKARVAIAKAVQS